MWNRSSSFVQSVPSLGRAQPLRTWLRRAGGAGLRHTPSGPRRWLLGRPPRVRAPPSRAWRHRPPRRTTMPEAARARGARGIEVGLVVSDADRSSRRRRRTSAPGRPAATGSRGGGWPGARRRPAGPGRGRSRARPPRRTRRSGHPPSRGGPRCTRVPDARASPARSRALTRSGRGVSHTVSDRGIRSRSAGVRGLPSSTVKAKRPPSGSAEATVRSRARLSRNASRVSSRRTTSNGPAGTGGTVATLEPASEPVSRGPPTCQRRRRPGSRPPPGRCSRAPG